VKFYIFDGLGNDCSIHWVKCLLQTFRLSCVNRDCYDWFSEIYGFNCDKNC